MRRLLSLGFLLVVGVLAYNFFMGTEAEKEEVRAITKEGKEVVNAIKNLLKSEKEKLDAGKYNGVIDKLKALKGTAQEFGEEYGRKLEEIESKKEILDRLQSDESLSTESEDQEKQLIKELEGLLNDIQQDIE